MAESGVRKTPLVEKKQARELLNNLDIHKSMKPERKHPGVLRELTDVIVRPLNYL